MFEYKVILYKLSVGNFLTEDCKSSFQKKDKFCSYDNILANSLANLIPNCTFEVISDDSIIHDNLSEYKISSNDQYGIPKNTSSNKFDLYDFIVIKKIKTEEYIIIDFQDGPKHSVVFGKNENCVGGYATMFLDLIDKIKDKNFYLDKFYPFSFFDLYPYYTYECREEIKTIRKNVKKIPRLVFYGTLGSIEDKIYTTEHCITGKTEPVRLVGKILKEKYPDLVDIKDRSEKLERKEWWRLAANYCMAVTIPGHPWCFREHEFWSLGIPTLANTFTCPLMIPLIGNKHYVDAGTVGKDYMDREIDQEQAADLIIQKFLELKDEEDYLTKIALNAQQRYDQFVFPEKAAIHLLNDIKQRYNFF